VETWWTRNPERLEFELQALRDARIPFTPVQESIDQGTYQLRLSPAVDGKTIELIAAFPDLYPYFRFEVFAPDLNLPHHQHAFAKTLCMIGRATHNWSSEFLLADFIRERLPLVLTAARTEDPAVAAQLEQAQGEPFSDYYSAKPAMCLVDSSWVIPQSVRFGSLTLGVHSFLRLAPGEPPCIQATVLEVRGENGELIVQAPSELREAFGSRQAQGRWSRADAPIAIDEAKALQAAARKLDPKEATLGWSQLWGLKFQVRGILFPEEIGHRQTGDAWVFVVRIQRPPAGASKPERHKKKHPKPFFKAAPAQPADDFYVARAGRAGPSDLPARVPELSPLRSKVVGQVGIGCLGAPSALEFARAGIAELRMLDDDVVEPGTTVRWPFGLAVAGRLKAEVVRAFIGEHYPYTKAVAYIRRLGMVRINGGMSDQAILAALTDGASLIYDTSAEFGVQYMLSEYARERRIPYVCVMGTQGGWGGWVVRIRPEQTAGCWGCFQALRLYDNFTEPPVAPTGEFQPIGCANPTFTGASFDLTHIALQGVRVAVSTLCEETANGYPATDGDITVVSLRAANGQLIAPTVQTFPLPRHPRCPVCERRAA
jgi:molybdopterin/thiamine biosynthesis adenylyltransferase